jgi:hypothetical protein
MRTIPDIKVVVVAHQSCSQSQALLPLSGFPGWLSDGLEMFSPKSLGLRCSYIARSLLAYQRLKLLFVLS